MAIGGTIYGHITTPWGTLSKNLRRHNLRVLEHLPLKDEWTPLTQPMFGITGPTVQEGAYDHDLIHYGVTLKAMDDKDALDWIAKFENLLRRLIWFEAKMHINWIFGERTFRWVVDRSLIQEIAASGLSRAIDRWEFQDGGNPIVRWSKR